MISSILRVAASVALIAVATTGSVRAEDDPQKFTMGLYDTGWDEIAADKGARAEWLSPDFAKVVTEQQRLHAFKQTDPDPLVGSPWTQISGVIAEVVDQAKDKITVKAKFQYDGKPGEMDLVLAKTDDGLRLDDVKDAGGKSTRLAMAKGAGQAKPAAADEKKKADNAGDKDSKPDLKKTAKKGKDKKSNG